jgi:hypothetical protein
MSRCFYRTSSAATSFRPKADTPLRGAIAPRKAMRGASYDSPWLAVNANRMLDGEKH